MNISTGSTSVPTTTITTASAKRPRTLEEWVSPSSGVGIPHQQSLELPSTSPTLWHIYVNTGENYYVSRSKEKLSQSPKNYFFELKCMQTTSTNSKPRVRFQSKIYADPQELEWKMAEELALHLQRRMMELEKSQRADTKTWTLTNSTD